MPATTLHTHERTLAALRAHARVVEQILNSVPILDGVPRAPSGTASRHKLPLVFSIPDHTIWFPSKLSRMFLGGCRDAANPPFGSFPRIHGGFGVGTVRRFWGHRSFMARTDFQKLLVHLKLDTKQKALQQALLVPWRRLEEAASAYVESHIFILWVRAIAEVREELPEVVASTLESRYPGFLDKHLREREQRPRQQRFLWHSLEEWIADRKFADAKTQGWFEAVMYYAYKDLRTEKAWALWEHTKDASSRRPPSIWPTLEEWTSNVMATAILTRRGTETARAIEALQKVEAARLRRAVAELVEWRAFALWIDSISQPNRPLEDHILSELRARCPSFLADVDCGPLWRESMFFRLIRLGDAAWCSAARAEKWYSALHYDITHHPRYHRLIHYNQRCHDEWDRVHPICYPSFPEWLRAADEYFLPQDT